MKKDDFKKGSLFLFSADSYIHLVKNILDENIKQGNIHIMVSDRGFSEKEYAELTKWSDFNIIKPIFFNFYHGLELLLKGFLLFKGKYRLTHCMSEIFKDFKKTYSVDTKIPSILEKYLVLDNMPSPLRQCLKDNSLNIDKLYEFFRYPIDKQIKKEHSYFFLEYKDKKGLSFLKELSNDIDIFIKEYVKIFKKIKKIKKYELGFYCKYFKF